MELYHLFSKHFGHDDYFEFTVFAGSHQQAFELAKKYASRDGQFYFDDDISHWKIEAVSLDKAQVIQSSIFYG